MHVIPIRGKGKITITRNEEYVTPENEKCTQLNRFVVLQVCSVATGF
jgi:hypothetical protein